MSHQNVVMACAGALRRSSALSAAIFIALLGVFSSNAGAAVTELSGDTFPVSVTPEGAYADGEGTGEFTPISISADGRYVAFESAATNLGEKGPAGVNEAFVKDLSGGAIELVSRADGVDGEPAGEPGIADLELSADGRYAIFTSGAGNLGTVLPGEDPSERHVYRRDLETDETALVDRVTGSGGAILSRGAEAAAISADGRYVAFTARVENLEDPTGDHAETAAAVGYVRDMQAGITPQIKNGAEITAQVETVLAAARRAGLRIFFIRHLSLPKKLMGAFQYRTVMAWQRTDSPEKVQPMFLRDSPAFQIVAQLQPLPSEAIFDKITMSAFEGTPLEIALRDCGVRSFIIVGIATEVGIDPTCRHGADLGFRPILVGDACGAGDKAAAEHSLAALRHMGDSTITDVKTVCDLLLKFERAEPHLIALARLEGIDGARRDGDLGRRIRRAALLGEGGGDEE